MPLNKGHFHPLNRGCPLYRGRKEFILKCPLFSAPLYLVAMLQQH